MSFITRCEPIWNKITQNIVVRILIVLTGLGIVFIAIPLLIAAIAYFLGMTEFSPVALVFSKNYIPWFLAIYFLGSFFGCIAFLFVKYLIIPVIEFVIYGW
jgi:hypothetical protein